MHRGRFPDVQLPLNFFVQDISISSILSSKGCTTILYAEHQQRLGTIVANRALAGWSHSYHAALLNREYFAIHLELALATQEEIQFLVVLVSMEEACLCARSKALE